MSDLWECAENFQARKFYQSQLHKIITTSTILVNLKKCNIKKNFIISALHCIAMFFLLWITFNSGLTEITKPSDDANGHGRKEEGNARKSRRFQKPAYSSAQSFVDILDIESLVSKRWKSFSSPSSNHFLIIGRSDRQRNSHQPLLFTQPPHPAKRVEG